MSESDSNSIANPSIWWRLLFILIYFSVVFYAVKVVITLVVVFQFLHHLKELHINIFMQEL